MLGSVQVKVKRSWDSGEMGIVKNASLGSKSVKYMVEGRIVGKRVYGLGTMGWIGDDYLIDNSEILNKSVRTI